MCKQMNMTNNGCDMNNNYFSQISVKRYDDKFVADNKIFGAIDLRDLLIF